MNKYCIILFFPFLFTYVQCINVYFPSYFMYSLEFSDCLPEHIEFSTLVFNMRKENLGDMNLSLYSNVE